jgi:GNAT superfamily N-acetyltransferase
LPSARSSTSAATSSPLRSSTRSTRLSASGSSTRCARSSSSSQTSLVQLRLVDPASPDAQRCLRAYVTELDRRAPQRGFDPRAGATAEPDEVRPPKGAFVVAYVRDDAIACGAVKHQPGDVTDIKRMWVAGSARGLGLGRRLLEHLEGLAREHGAREARLETTDVLPEAISLYGPRATSRSHPSTTSRSPIGGSASRCWKPRSRSAEPL